MVTSFMIRFTKSYIPSNENRKFSVAIIFLFIGGDCVN